MRRMRCGVLAGLLALWAGCGSADSLSGSIGGTYSLAFDSVQVRQVASAYTVTYLLGSGAAQQTTARLVYTPSAAGITPGQPMTLTFGANGNAAVTRATMDMLTYPDGQTGTITFDSAPVVGATLSGRFGVSFQGGDTLAGHFSAPLEAATQ